MTHFGVLLEDNALPLLKMDVRWRDSRPNAHYGYYKTLINMHFILGQSGWGSSGHSGATCL